VKSKRQLIRQPINTATQSLRSVLHPNFARLANVPYQLIVLSTNSGEDELAANDAFPFLPEKGFAVHLPHIQLVSS
jgi:hypothetical protein